MNEHMNDGQMNENLNHMPTLPLFQLIQVNLADKGTQNMFIPYMSFS